MECSISLCTLQYKPNVKFVVADCGFTNLYELIGAGYKTAGMGAWTPLINTALILADGFDMKKTSAIDAIKDNTIPICSQRQQRAIRSFISFRRPDMPSQEK